MAHDQVVPEVHYSDSWALLPDQKESVLHVVPGHAAIHGHLLYWDYNFDDQILARDKHDGALGADGPYGLGADVHLLELVLQEDEE